MTYKEQYKHPKWQKKRLEILNRDEFSCTNCGSDSENLHVHHYLYHKDAKVWEYHNSKLTTLCEDCHSEWHEINDAIKTTLCLDNTRLSQVFDLLCLINGKNPFELMQLRKIIEEINKLSNG